MSRMMPPLHTPAAAWLRVDGLTHAFGAREVLAQVSLQVPAGRCVALVGPSGCGKTTLLHLCAGLLTPQAGRLHNSFGAAAVMFQQALLLPWLTALDNIALGLKAQGVPRAQRHARAREMAQTLGLDALALRQFPHQLSGGMQSRAALARALVLAPELLLLDEPFAALDIGLKAQMHRLLQAQRMQRELAVLMITHDVMEAVTLADTVLVMAAHPGRVVWQLDIDRHPARRGEGWVHAQTAALLSQPVVRQAFGLPGAVPEEADTVSAGASSARGSGADMREHLPGGSLVHAPVRRNAGAAC